MPFVNFSDHFFMRICKNEINGCRIIFNTFETFLYSSSEQSPNSLSVSALTGQIFAIDGSCVDTLPHEEDIVHGHLQNIGLQKSGNIQPSRNLICKPSQRVLIRVFTTFSLAPAPGMAFFMTSMLAFLFSRCALPLSAANCFFPLSETESSLRPFGFGAETMIETLYSISLVPNQENPVKIHLCGQVHQC